MRYRSTSRVGLALALMWGLALAGCDQDDESATTAVEADAEAKQAAVDPDLAKAMAAASAKQPGAGPEASQGQGPPPKGLFGPGAADKQLPRGGAPRITVGSQGEQPRVSLRSMQPQPGSKTPIGIRLAIQIGRNATPTIEFGLVLEVPKAKRAAGEEEAPAGPQPVDVVLRVASTALDPAQARRLPEQEKKLVSKFKGGRVSYRVAPNGAASGFTYELAEGADPGLQHPFNALGEVITTATLPYPDQPVGKGAYWMATTRETFGGFDTVAYRFVKVEKVQGDRVFLELNVKRYAASAELKLEGLPANLGQLKVDGFRARGSGRLVVRSGAPFPIEGRLSSELTVMATASKAPGQLLPIVQSRVSAELINPPGAAGARN